MTNKRERGGRGGSGGFGGPIFPRAGRLGGGCLRRVPPARPPADAADRAARGTGRGVLRVAQGSDCHLRARPGLRHLRAVHGAVAATMKVYVATSWKNAHQPDVVAFLRGAGHEVYDFRHPETGNDGFHWTAIDGGWREWDAHRYLAALRHPVAERGFALDMNALRWCDACVLVLPCGRSAHLEAGWAAGAGKVLVIYIPDYDTPELMYGMAGAIVTTLADIEIALFGAEQARR